VDVLRAMAHEVMVLQAGQVLESGPAQQVLTQPEHVYTRSLVEAFAHVPSANASGFTGA
jgi:ABC-type microcin C transport system duplicated ATPase subunit YejF